MHFSPSKHVVIAHGQTLLRCDRCGEEVVQVQSIGEKHAWVCSLDENFLGWGCVKVSQKKITSLVRSKYDSALSTSKGPNKRKRTSAYEKATNEHKVLTHDCEHTCVWSLPDSLGCHPLAT